jgi:hypothetical protein
MGTASVVLWALGYSEDWLRCNHKTAIATAFVIHCPAHHFEQVSLKTR